MNTDIDVAFTLNDPGRQLARHPEAALFGFVLQAVTQAFSLPVAALVGSIIVNVTHAYLEIKLELNDLSVQSKIAQRQKVCELISDALYEMDAANYHPLVRGPLERSLISLLASELLRADC